MNHSAEIMLAVRRALMLSIAAAAAASPPVLAQNADQDEDDVQSVVVTGSRIARQELDASTPVQVLTSESLDAQGAPNVADILGELPAVGTAAFSRNNSNFLTSGNGISTINLRNVNDKRTLVLINGRRAASGVGGSSTVDLNNIPTDLIEQIEVVTGGASAVYGSEAIAGVVNFRLKRDFEGSNFRLQSGMTSEGDNDRYLGSYTGGWNFSERGNVTFNAQFDKDLGLRSNRRDISKEDIPFRSSFVPQGRFPVPGGTNWTYDANNTLQAGFSSAVDGYNRNADRYIAVPLERWLLTGLAHYDLNSDTRVFFEAGYSDVKSRSRLEALATDNSDARDPSGNPSSGLSIDNPFIPAEIRAEMIELGVDTLPMIKRMNGVFDRSNRNDRTFYRAVAGLEGSLFDQDWKWDLYFNQSETEEDTRSETGLRDRFFFALDAITDSSTGQPVCRDAGARAQGCVPFNPFGFDSVSDEAAAYVTNGQFDTYLAKVEQQVIAANIAGSPFAVTAGDVQIAAGIERREEKSSETYSAQTQAGNTLGNALSNTAGRYTVNEAYLEGVVPLLRDAPGAQDLTFESAVRFGDYSTVGSVFSWKAGTKWSPVEDFSFRAVYARATRAPNIGELFQGRNQTFPPGLSDPCDGVTATTAGAVADYCRSIPGIAQQIQANGVFAYDPNADLQSIEGFDFGNPDVNEETARTWTVGAVLTPQFAPQLTMTVDWFQIEIDDAVILAPRQTTINDCVNTLGQSPLCALITREDVNTPRPRTPGTVFQVDSPFVNAASIETRGVDLGARYRVPFETAGTVNLGLTYTYLDKLTQKTAADTPIEDNRGQLNGSGRLGAGFKHRANLSARYDFLNFRANWRINYLSSMKDTLDEAQASLDPEENSIGSYVYHDAQFRYSLGSDQQYDLYLGVDNVFDKKPPLITQNGASNITGTETAADTYDPIGRFIYAGVELTF